MRQALQFPVDYPVWGNGELGITFEALAVPPRHELVSSVFGWVFYGDEILLVKHSDRGWELPGGPRRPGETFRETLARRVWEAGGVLLASARTIGATRITNCSPCDTQSQSAHSARLTAYCIAHVRELLPFSEEFEGEDRMLIEPALVSKYVKDWSPLMDEMLQFAMAARTPSQIETWV